MIKKTITYNDVFTDEEFTKDFYFNLSEVEVLEYMAEDEEGIDKVLQRIIEAPTAKAVLKQLKILVRMAYGYRNDNGLFMKDEESTKVFLASEAYSVLLEEMILDEEKAADFAIQILPKKYRAEAKKANSGKNAKKINPKPATKVEKPKVVEEPDVVVEKKDSLSELSDEDIRKLAMQAVANQNHTFPLA